MAKIFCYGVLIVAFLLFFQNDPFVALIILTIIFALVLFVRKRKNNRGGSIFSFLSGKSFNQTTQLNDLVMALALENLLNNSKENSFENNPEIDEKKKQIEIIKEEVMELLERG